MDRDCLEDGNKKEEVMPEIKDCVCGRIGLGIMDYRPFGIGPKLEDRYERHQLYCPDCGRTTFEYSTKEEAIKAWNAKMEFIAMASEVIEKCKAAKVAKSDLPETKPCPYCGTKTAYVREDSYFNKKYVTCYFCHARGGYGDNNEKAITIWNRVSDCVHGQSEQNLKDLQIETMRKEMMEAICPCCGAGGLVRFHMDTSDIGKGNFLHCQCQKCGFSSEWVSRKDGMNEAELKAWAKWKELRDKIKWVNEIEVIEFQNKLSEIYKLLCSICGQNKLVTVMTIKDGSRTLYIKCDHCGYVHKVIEDDNNRTPKEIINEIDKAINKIKKKG